uniref:Uncharacterized protein n=1 Tax=Meloidogyne enterolobii TaxID=390850 RepID=A0A6V7XU73_MELEN|nr:unnamed protein product [Meloidogyne enterolobii]
MTFLVYYFFRKLFFSVMDTSVRKIPKQFYLSIFTMIPTCVGDRGLSGWRLRGSGRGFCQKIVGVGCYMIL